MSHRDGIAGALGGPPAIGLAVALEGRLGAEALAALLSGQDDFRVLGLATTGEAALALCRERRPAVLVLGILAGWPRDLPPRLAVRGASPATRILAVAPHGRDRCARLNPRVEPPAACGPAPWTRHSTCLPRARALGVHGVIHGDATPEALFAAVRALARGEPWPGGARPRWHAAGSPLSAQEREVARLVGQGASNKEIGGSLGISDLTVKKHVGNIFRKLGLHDRLQLGLCIARDPGVLDGAGERPGDGPGPGGPALRRPTG